MTDHVLVLGYRAGLAQALRELEVPFVRYDGELPTSRDAVIAAMREVEPQGPFTHVIAGGEAAVVPAAHARRALGARAAPTTISLRCHDKLTMKRYLRDKGVPMTPFLVDEPELSDAQILDELGAPVVVKARGRSGGRGIAFARDLDELRAARKRGALLERFVDAPEMSVESFVVDGEIQLESFTDYHQKTAVNVVPAPLDAETEAAVRALNRQVLKALKLTWGLTHLEVYLTDEGPLFGEVALRPPGGYIMETLGAAWGIDAWRAFACVELGRPFDFPAAPIAHAAAWILHPGEGRVARVVGKREVKAHPAVRLVKIKVKAGDEIAARAGVGEDVGRVILAADSHAELIAALDEVQATLRVELA